MLYNELTSFTVHDVVSLVKPGEWNKVDICLAPPNDHEFDSADDSGDEDFGGTFFYYINSIFQWSTLKIEHFL